MNCLSKHQYDPGRMRSTASGVVLHCVLKDGHKDSHLAVLNGETIRW